MFECGALEGLDFKGFRRFHLGHSFVCAESVLDSIPFDFCRFTSF